jgi:pyruvate oxidase
MEQKVEGYPKFATNLKNPDSADYAISCGGVGYKVKKPNELRDALEKAMAAKKPAIVDVETDPKRF